MTPIRPKAVAASKEGLSDLPKSIQTEKGRVLRLWKGRSTVERASEYVHHATEKVFPALRVIDGHRGAYLLRHMVDGAIEFVVLTLWDSMATVRRFAGAEPDKAVVEAEARAILASFDEE
jgi:heme-degrading monooxygenase HmoA